MKKYFLLTIAALICCNTFSQKFDNVWVFGDSAMLDFSTAPPSYNISAIYGGYEANASIADSAGNLQFYTNGEKVWNREHNVMPNGDSLHIGEIFVAAPGSSITQGVIILPFPESNYLYYIFQIQGDGDSNYGIEYSIVDMNLNDGLGDITKKNLELFGEEVEEKMHAVKHGNGRDWWLLLRNKDEVSLEVFSLTFLKYLITPNGIEGPFYQEYGPEWEIFIDAGYGQMIFSSAGNKIGYPRGAFETGIYDFDRCTGELSNYTPIQTGSYGISLSPDGTKLYVSKSEKNVYQFCLDCVGEPLDSTKQLVYDGPEGGYCLGQHMLGPDGKIYIVTARNTVPNNSFTEINQNLCVINRPNDLYPLCDFDTNTVSLGPRRVILGLPNMPNYDLGALIGSECDTLVTIHTTEIKNKITIYPNPAAENLFINITSNNFINAALNISDATGKIVLSQTLISANTKINIAPLSKGIYFVTLKQDEKIVFKESFVKP